MVKLEITLQEATTKTEGFVATDILKIEDATAFETAIIRKIEGDVSEIIKKLPQLIIKDTRKVYENSWQNKK